MDGGDVDEESVPLYPKGPTKGPVAATNAAAPEKQRQPAESNVSFKKVLAFSGPLALSELVQRVSRPVRDATQHACSCRSLRLWLRLWLQLPWSWSWCVSVTGYDTAHSLLLRMFQLLLF